MKILYHINQIEFNSAEKWIFDAWRSGFEKFGYKVETVESYQLQEKINNFKPDILMTDICILKSKKDFKIISSATSSGIKTAMWVHWPLVPEHKNKDYVFEKKDQISLFFGEREGIEKQFFEDTSMKYLCLTNSSRDDIHYHGDFKKNLETDILYIGTRLYKKKWFEDKIINNLIKRKDLKVKVLGLGWERKDFFIRAFRKIFKLLRLKAIENLLAKQTIKITSELERDLYASAKICLNFHEREEDGSQPHHIVNQRTFKIASCGGFQIVDKVNALKKYFDDDQIVSLDLNQDEWLKKIDYYLENPSERNKIKMNGHKRALKDHYASNRVKVLLKHLGF